MRHRKNNDGSFILAFVINLLINPEGAIPATILLVLHFVLDWPMWPFWVALILWPLGLFIYTAVLSWVVNSGSQPVPHRENVNPYSAGRKKPAQEASEISESAVLSETVIEQNKSE